MMIEQHRSSVTVKAGVPTKVGPMTGPAETANVEATRGTLEVPGHGLGLMILMEI